MRKFSTIIVANRLPVSVTKEAGKLTFKASAGGLATAMSSIPGEQHNTVWVGWPGIDADQLTENEKSIIIKKLAEYNCFPLFLTQQEVTGFYEGYANDMLWPLFHYFQSYANFNPSNWNDYQIVNKRFAQAVRELAMPEATIWIHDYHFMLLPRNIRALLPKASIGFFLHIPFPTFEIFRLLPERQKILEGLLGADLIGFQTHAYTQYFLESTKRVLGAEIKSGAIRYDGRITLVDAFPIGIDYEKYVNAAKTAAVKKAATTIRAAHHHKKILLSMDRLDYSKGIPNRLDAYEKFLIKHPERHKTVSLVVIAVPSRANVQQYKDLRTTIEQTISRINGRFGTIDWAPISYIYKNLPFFQIAAFFATADIALITPLRDGMNLVAKEYVASRQNGTGVLVLSELTGAADELQEAIRINPNDTDALADAIEQALQMPDDEQHRRLEVMQKRIAHYTISRWTHDFLDQLSLAKTVQTRRSASLLSDTMQASLRDRYANADRRLLLLDYDGTLKSFVSSPDPQQAAPSQDLYNLLQTLAANPKTELVIISGRPREALDAWFKSMPITLVSEHGAWIKRSNTWQRGVTTSADFKKLIRPLLDHYAERTAGALVEEKELSLVWHYRNVPPELAYARNMSLLYELGDALAGTEIAAFEGNKIIEIKPSALQKGSVINRLIGKPQPEFILCAGDDYTDEDMFAALPMEAISIKVGYGPTKAHFQVASVTQFLRVLASLIQKSSPPKG